MTSVFSPNAYVAFLENSVEGLITEKNSTLLANVKRNNEKPPVNDALELFFHSEIGSALEYVTSVSRHVCQHFMCKIDLL